MNKTTAEILLEKYLEGRATVEERAMVERWYVSEADRRKLQDTDDFEHMRNEIWLGVRSKAGLPLQLPSKKTFNYRYFAAASVLIVLALGLLFYTTSFNPFGSDLKLVRLMGKDIPAGKNKARLTLADGRTIELSDAKKGIVIQAAALTYDDGTTVSAIAEDQANLNPQTIVLQTPKGGKYELILQDGTKVWLNAASTIRFPASFKGAGNREIVLQGEAYFEVAKDKAHPFQVSTEGQRVQVLGTHFNINSYQDENNIRTTLLEGLVQVNEQVIHPGQQAVLSKNGQMKVVSVHADAAVAWKNEVFQFEETDFASIMRQLARWYDVDIRYQGPMPVIHYTGSIPRKSNISEVLEMLEETGAVRFKIAQRTVTVSNR